MSDAGASPFASAESPSGSESIPAFQVADPVGPSKRFRAPTVANGLACICMTISAGAQHAAASDGTQLSRRAGTAFAGVEIRDQMQRSGDFSESRGSRGESPKPVRKEDGPITARISRQPKTWQVLLTSFPTRQPDDDCQAVLPSQHSRRSARICCLSHSLKLLSAATLEVGRSMRSLLTMSYFPGTIEPIIRQGRGRPAG